MTASKNLYAIIPLEYDIFFGMDVDKKNAAITIVSHKKNLFYHDAE